MVLSRAALIASAEATHRRLGGPGTWVLALPAHYVAGLMVLVRSLVADRPVLEVDARLDRLSGLDLGPGPHYLSLVPTQLARALAEPATSTALAAVRRRAARGLRRRSGAARAGRGRPGSRSSPRTG